ncbi:peptide/nickel transport system substrate-binding protein [Streptomyces sp. DvalAA-14]|uniref:ABC transporter substrate-binding protein n=1 Tax=unclassified Streptomyces TaxID=2593676 RepID=UPI00081B136F|nr:MULTISPECIES: ABC transporter substrate-binding protein [unclassified Streptomyces]MYS20282.1 ABC transporter substrate-binding protein [Streptomyces sp. SID4948]SCD65318.1 peptide/nickel transport system substrate-binding protein [Streptomyces sp. DvalAA-14]
MNSRKATAALALATALALGASACSSNSNDDKKPGGTKSAAGVSAKKDAALTGIVNASDKKGGTVTMENSDVPDSLDPGNTYYGWVQNFSRLYARTLLTFKPAAGKEGLTVVPDLATGLGKPSADAKTWTYTIRSGLKYDDGTPITTKDIKYAIERSNFAPEALSNGPTYFKAYLAGGDKYPGPYKDKDPNGIASIETPNDTTIVFHLAKPFADFDYLATFSQTAPVPQAKDDGAGYVKHIVSSGPYKFKSYQDGVGADLVRNPEWTKASDPVRSALPDEIKIKFKVDATSIDNDLLAGNTTVDSGGTGVSPQTQAKVINPQYAKNTDDSYAGATSYLAINSNVAPFNNIDCRKAVEYAIDKVSVQTAIGGSVKGDVATTLLPPTVNGYTKFDEYPTAGDKGDATKAKASLSACGKAGGFTTNLTARSDRPAEMAEATAIQNSLKQVGITANIKSFPAGKYFSNFAGVPSYVHSHQLGLMLTAWGADWPTGYGFLDQIVDGSAIKPSGGNNLQELNDPAINSALAAAISNTDANARSQAWGQIDKMVVDTATVVPLIYRKNLLYRPDSATNVTVTQAYLGMYDYLLLGSSK